MAQQRAHVTLVQRRNCSSCNGFTARVDRVAGCCCPRVSVRLRFFGEQRALQLQQRRQAVRPGCGSWENKLSASKRKTASDRLRKLRTRHHVPLNCCDGTTRSGTRRCVRPPASPDSFPHTLVASLARVASD